MAQKKQLHELELNQNPKIKDGASGLALPILILTLLSVVATAGVFLVPFGIKLQTVQSQLVYAGILSVSTFLAASLISVLLTYGSTRESHRTELIRLGLIIARRLALLRSKINHLGDRIESLSAASNGDQARDGWIVHELRLLGHDAHASTTDITNTTNLDPATVDTVFSQAEIRLKDDVETFFCVACGKRNLAQVPEGIGHTRHHKCERCSTLLLVHRNAEDCLLVSEHRKPDETAVVVDTVAGVTALVTKKIPAKNIAVECGGGCGSRIAVTVGSKDKRTTVVRNCYECYERNEIEIASGKLANHSKAVPTPMPLTALSETTSCPTCTQKLPGRPYTNKKGLIVWSCNHCHTLYQLT